MKTRSINAKDTTIKLVIMLLLGVITGIIGVILYTPASELYVAQNTFYKESRAIYDFDKDSEARANQVAKAEESRKVLETVTDKYSADSNILIAKYTKIHSDFVKILIVMVIIAPYLAIVSLLLKERTTFIFALANILIVAPVKGFKTIFNSFKTEKKPKKRLASN